MLRIFLKALKTGVVTQKYPLAKEPAPPQFRGLPDVNGSRCDGCGTCVSACPAKAISLAGPEAAAGPGLVFNLDRCIFCGQCAEVCPTGAVTLTGNYELAARCLEDLKITVPLAKVR